MIETKMSLFTSNLTVPDSIFAATLSLSWILKITEVSGGKSLGGGGKRIEITVSLPWSGHNFVESLTHRAACMQQPQWTPLTTAGSTVHFCFCSLSFPTSPPPSLHIQHHSTGSLMADSTQEILHRSLAREYMTSPPLCQSVKMDPFFYSELSH